MHGFLEAVGTESAERRLSAFLTEVRAATPAVAAQETHRAVLTAAVITLKRRVSAREVLDSQHGEATAEVRLTEFHLTDLERTVDAALEASDDARLLEAARRLEILMGIVPVVARQAAQAKRARQWIADLGAAAAEWRAAAELMKLTRSSFPPQRRMKAAFLPAGRLLFAPIRSI